MTRRKFEINASAAAAQLMSSASDRNPRATSACSWLLHLRHECKITCCRCIQRLAACVAYTARALIMNWGSNVSIAARLNNCVCVWCERSSGRRSAALIANKRTRMTTPSYWIYWKHSLAALLSTSIRNWAAEIGDWERKELRRPSEYIISDVQTAFCLHMQPENLIQ